MAKKSKFYKSKSLYGIKKMHAKTNNGIIFERDHFTILRDDGLYDENNLIVSESNFKFQYRPEPVLNKRHFRGNWVKNGDDTWWTLSTLPSSSLTISDESKIVLKPNYNSLKDFALYGSAVELVRTTINDIILRFPGGIYYPGEKGQTVFINNVKYYAMLNPYNIDFWTHMDEEKTVTLNNGNVLPLKILTISYEKYGLTTQPVLTVYEADRTCPNTIIGEIIIDDKTFKIYFDNNGDLALLTETPGNEWDVLIEPKEEYLKAFWDSLNDFENVLLDRNSFPLYRAVFNTPYFNGTKYVYTKKSYEWPKIKEDSMIPDVLSVEFTNYLTALIDLATHHDEYDSDVIWRMLTHEAIKNMDWSHINGPEGEVLDEVTLDTSRVRNMLNIQGRQFDDIKRYADNIKNSIKITYDENGNVPDYFLSDNVSLKGWDAINVIPKKTKEDYSEALKFANGSILLTSGRTESWVNSSFLRNLSLNSDYINSLKGTRIGLETILGLFGMKNNEDYEIIEYYQHITNITEMLKDDFDKYIEIANVRGFNEDREIFYNKYPVAFIEDKEQTYLIPWVNKETTDFYFQSKGGWGKRKSKTIDLEIAPNVKNIKSDENFKIYSETIPYIKYVSNIDAMRNLSDLICHDNMICFVNDIGNIINEEYYTPKSDEPVIYENASHYFILENKNLSYYAGYIDNEYHKCWGWRNISKSEIENENSLTFAGKVVLHMESIPSIVEGNNPHIGYGEYDDGESFYSAFENIFKQDIKNGDYDFLRCGAVDDSDITFEEIENYGFQMEEILCNNLSDKVKSLYHTDDDGIHTKDPASLNITDILKDYENLNSKRLTIKFKDSTNSKFSSEYKDYINNIVLRYLEPMIPSTTILNYEFWDDND